MKIFIVFLIKFTFILITNKLIKYAYLFGLCVSLSLSRPEYQIYIKYKLKEKIVLFVQLNLVEN